jgi:NAD(P)-dependent dehydrogenase (short-subunit alcohol dehydrogenase family)
VITGASAGVGRAVAQLLAPRGTRIALLARGEAGLRGAAEDVRARGGEALPIETDVSDHRQVEAAADRATRELGPIDLWVNAAFASVFAPFTETRPEEFRRVTEVTYLGYVHGTQAALARMLPRGSGTIVQVGSALAYRSIPLQSAYCGAKHAIVGFTTALRTELLHDRSGVRVTMVHLPAVNTPQFGWVLARLRNQPQPVPPIYQPEVAARAVLYAAARPGRREYWVGRSTVGAIVGNRLVPGLLDRYLARSAYRSQQTDEPLDPRRPVNLWHPVDGRDGTDHGAHGSFDERSTRHSPQVWLSQHREALVAGAIAAGAAVAACRPWRAGHLGRR